ncbi:MAG: choice-of-anchor L domain-containing protein [Bacteroidota bacterium]
MKKIYFAFLFTAISLSNGFSQLTFTVSPSMADLTNYFQGVGLTISNMTVTGAPNSYGFYSGTSNMAFGSGIIMSTGVVNGLISNPAGAFASTDNMTMGDPLISVIAGGATYDACIIEFDCVPSNANLLFSFAFGSEEYNEFVYAGFNDAFAIAVTGPNPAGGNYNNTNFAFVPGTTTPMVSVNSINNGQGGTGPCNNCAYYIDNTNGTDVAFDGFTTGLQGLVPVTIGQTYHFKLAIADVGDGVFDSSVMFLTNSFKSVPNTPTGVLETENDINVSIYPNPTSGSIVHVDIEKNTANSLELYSYQGKRVENIQYDKNTHTIQLNNTAKGVYFLHITTDKGKTVKKLVVN